MAFLKGYSVVFPEGKDYRILRERRVTSNLTQQQVADKAGIKLQQYQKFESGERNLRTASFQVACRVLEALDLDIVKYFHKGYAWGEKRFLDSEGWKFEKTSWLSNSASFFRVIIISKSVRSYDNVGLRPQDTG